MKAFLSHLRASLAAMVVFGLLLGGLYPLLVWSVAQTCFPQQANGSLLYQGGRVVGSSLIAQGFTTPPYFHPRPSAAGNGYDPTSSGGTNLGPTSDKLMNGVHKKAADGKDDPNNADGISNLISTYRLENGLDDHVLIPIDAVTRSASGLDPHISLANAKLQVTRVAQARHLQPEVVQRLIRENTQGPDLGVIGEERVNVLTLNLALDDVK